MQKKIKVTDVHNRQLQSHVSDEHCEIEMVFHQNIQAIPWAWLYCENFTRAACHIWGEKKTTMWLF